MAAYGFIDDRDTAKSEQFSEFGGGRAGGGGDGEGGASAAKEQDLGARRNSGLVWSFVGGSFAGLCQAAVIVPTDIIKIKLQVMDDAF